MRAGLHTSIAGALEAAALEAANLGANTFQIFSSSPRMWKASVPSKPAIALLNKAREKHDLYPLVIHDNYLINLASADPDIRRKSIDARGHGAHAHDELRPQGQPEIGRAHV